MTKIIEYELTDTELQDMYSPVPVVWKDIERNSVFFRQEFEED